MQNLLSAYWQVKRRKRVHTSTTRWLLPVGVNKFPCRIMGADSVVVYYCSALEFTLSAKKHVDRTLPIMM